MSQDRGTHTMVVGRLGVLFLVVFSTWKIGTPFFWRDDWYFLVRFSEFRPVFLFEPHGGHFFPVFKLAYWIQLSILGVNVPLLHYLSLAVFVGVCWQYLRIAEAVLGSRSLAFFTSLLLAVHPVNFVALLWPFEICVLLHLFFQMWALRMCLEPAGAPRLWPLIGLLTAQHLTFSNGHFVPLAAAVALKLSRGRDHHTSRAMIFLAALSVVFVLGQYWVLRGTTASIPSSFLVSSSGYPLSLLGFLLTNVARGALLLDEIVGRESAQIGGIAILVLGAWLARADRVFASGITTPLVWLFATSVIVPFARAGSAEQIYYYNTLALAPSLVVVVMVVRHIAAKVLSATEASTAWLEPAAVALLCGLALLDQRLAGVFESRNAKNKEALVLSLKGADRFAPFDDPVVDSATGLRVDSAEAKRAYQYWQRRAVLPDLNRY